MERYHKAFLSQLNRTDSILHSEVMHQGPILLPSTDIPFRHLIRIIVGQQLSTKAAETIYKRIEANLGFGYMPSDVVNASEYTLRSLGLSRSKVNYVRAVAQAAGLNAENFNIFETMTDIEVQNSLTNIKGIGVWSAQMFLMFQLRRTDVFAPGDLGLRKAISKLYGTDITSSDDVWLEIAKAWAPFRTLASMHLWRTLP